MTELSAVPPWPASVPAHTCAQRTESGALSTHMHGHACLVTAPKHTCLRSHACTHMQAWSHPHTPPPCRLRHPLVQTHKCSPVHAPICTHTHTGSHVPFHMHTHAHGPTCSVTLPSSLLHVVGYTPPHTASAGQYCVSQGVTGCGISRCQLPSGPDCPCSGGLSGAPE